jgi:hypothetical protein
MKFPPEFESTICKCGNCKRQMKKTAVEKMPDILRYSEEKNERQLKIGKIPDRRSVTCIAWYPILQLFSSIEMVEKGP